MDLAAVSPPLSTWVSFITLAGFLGTGGFVFLRGARKADMEAAQTTINLRTEEIEALRAAREMDRKSFEDELARLKERCSKLEADNVVLTEKVTSAAAVRNLIEQIGKWREEDAAEHADLASTFGRLLAKEGP